MNDEESFEEENVESTGTRSLSLLWSEFEEKFPTEDDCLSELFRIFQIEICCHSCESRNIEVHENRRSGVCTDCRNESWFTANSVLERIRKPKARLAAIWLTTMGVILKSPSFSAIVEIAQSSALEILKWTRVVIELNIPGNAYCVESSHFLSVFRKRSFLTPAEQHPSAEQAEMEKMAEHDEMPKEALEPVELHLLDLVGTKAVYAEEIIQRAGLPVGVVNATLTMMELKNVLKRLPGDRYERVTEMKSLSPLSAEISEAITGFLSFIRTNYGGISRRYLQSYLAAFWCHNASSRHTQIELLQTCFRKLAGVETKLQDYRTPLIVKVA